jgi:MFS family permease
VVPGAWIALALLIGINIFNFVDRQVLAAVEPEVRREFFPEAGDEKQVTRFVKTMMAMLSYAFLISYMATAPVFARLSTRTSRWLLIGVGVGIWSVASGASGLAQTYWLMFLTRCFVGVGEGVYGPVAPDVISDLYPVSRRGQVLAWFYAAIPVGGALGYALGGQVVAMHYEWRWAFYLVVPPGLLLGLFCLFMKEPPRGRTDGVAQVRRSATLTDYRVLMRTPSYVLNCLGMTAMSFAIGGLAFWAPEFIEEKHAERLFGFLEPKTAFGVFTVLSGLVATLAGGLLADQLKPRYPGSYFLVSGIALILAVPAVILMVALPFPLAWIPLVVTVFCLFFNTGPTNTILANVTHPQVRAAGFALNIFIIHFFGDGPSPIVMGVISDFSPGGTLDYAFLAVSVTALVGGLFWLWGVRYLERDTLLAPTRLGSESEPNKPSPLVKEV